MPGRTPYWFGRANESTDELAIDLIGQSVDLVSASREKPTRILDAVDARAFASMIRTTTFC
jgi:hypothetical protein